MSLHLAPLLFTKDSVELPGSGCQISDRAQRRAQGPTMKLVRFSPAAPQPGPWPGQPCRATADAGRRAFFPDRGIPPPAAVARGGAGRARPTLPLARAESTRREPLRDCGCGAAPRRQGPGMAAPVQKLMELQPVDGKIIISHRLIEMCCCFLVFQVRAINLFPIYSLWVVRGQVG
jgi:hypothetical protein